MISRLFRNHDVAPFLSQDIIIPVVASGHVKQMHNTENVNRILDALAYRFGDQIVYWSVKEAAEYWLKRLRPLQPPARAS
jgi:hypothetical protein